MLKRCHKGLFLSVKGKKISCKLHGVDLPGMHLCLACKEGRFPPPKVALETEGCSSCTQRKLKADNKVGDFKLSAVITALDEGKEVEKTVNNFFSRGVDEIILVDDGSSDGSCRKFTDKVVLVRNETPEGPAFCRNLGISLASGDMIVMADAHEAALQSLRPFANRAFLSGGIFCSTTAPLYGQDFRFFGGQLTFDEPTKYRFRVAYNSSIRGRELHPVSSLIGACYTFRKSVWEKLGGWVPTFSWGYNEQAMSMKAWLAGVNIYVDPTTVVRHLYKERFNWEVDEFFLKRESNVFLTHKVLFSKNTWENFWLPNLKSYCASQPWGAKVLEYGLLVSESDEANVLHEEFEKIKRRTDEEFFTQRVAEADTFLTPLLTGLKDGLN